MTKLKNLPTSFSVFKNKKKNIKNAEAKSLLNHFAYRYRLAASFQSMNAPEVGKTLTGYDAILKLFLAYTAYEAVVKAAFSLKVADVRHVSENFIIDKQMIKRIRDSEKLKNYLLMYKHSEDLKANLDFALNKNLSDIVCIAYALRNIFAHGDLTPSVIGLEKKSERQLITDLADTLLAYCDGVFTKCMNYT